MRLINVLGILLIASFTLVQANIFERNARQKFSYGTRNGNIKSSLKGGSSTAANQPPTLLDVMRQRYFSIEDAIWNVIDSGLEQSYALQQIHSGHKTFLQEDFLEKSCYFSTFDPEQRIVNDAIQRINQSVVTTLDNYLHSSRQFYRETDALAVSARNLNLTYYFDRLIEIADTSDFYMTVRNVSDFAYIFCSFIRFASSFHLSLLNLYTISINMKCEHAKYVTFIMRYFYHRIYFARVHKKRTKNKKNKEAENNSAQTE